MEGNNSAVELRSRSHLIQYEGVARNYAPLFLSLQLYRERGLLAARQLRKLAEQLHLVTKESMEQRRTGCKVRGLGSVIATGAGVAGFFLTGPFILGAVIAGSAVGVGGQMAVSLSDSRKSREEQGLLKRIQVIYNEFEAEMTRVRDTVSSVFNIETEDVRFLDRMLENILSDIEYSGVHMPELKMLEGVVNNLLTLQDSLTQDQQQEIRGILGNFWHFVSPCLVSWMEGPDIQGLCEHSMFTPCTSTPPSTSNFRCYSAAGKALHTLGLVVNVANMTVSSWELHSLNRKLQHMDTLKEEDQIRYLGGVADELMNKSINMENTINIIFQNNFS